MVSSEVVRIVEEKPSERKKVVYDTRRKRVAPKKGDEEEAASAAPAEPAVEVCSQPAMHARAALSRSKV